MRRREWSVGSSGGSGAKLGRGGSTSRGGSTCSACSALSALSGGGAGGTGGSGSAASILSRTNCTPTEKKKKKSDLRGAPSTLSTRKASTTGESHMGRVLRTSLRVSVKKKQGPQLTRKVAPKVTPKVTPKEAQKGANKLVQVSPRRRTQKITSLSTYSHKYRLSKTCSLKKSCQKKRNTSTPRGSSNCSERPNGLIEEQQKCHVYYHRGVPKDMNGEGVTGGSHPGDVPNWDELYSFFPHVYNRVDSDDSRGKGTPSGGVTHAPGEYPEGQICEEVKEEPCIHETNLIRENTSFQFAGSNSNEEDRDGEVHPLGKGDTNGELSNDYITYKQYVLKSNSNGRSRMEGGRINWGANSDRIHFSHRGYCSDGEGVAGREGIIQNGNVSEDLCGHLRGDVDGSPWVDIKREGVSPTHGMKNSPTHRRNDKLEEDSKQDRHHACAVNGSHLKSPSFDMDGLDDVHSNFAESFSIKHLPEVPNDVAILCSSDDDSVGGGQHGWRSSLTGEQSMHEGGGGATGGYCNCSGNDESDVYAEGKNHFRKMIDPNGNVLNDDCYSKWVGLMTDSSRHFGESAPLSHSDNYFCGVTTEDQPAGDNADGDDLLGNATDCVDPPCCVREELQNSYSLQRPHFSNPLYSHNSDASIMHIDSLEDVPGPFEKIKMHQGEKCADSPYVGYVIEEKNTMEEVHQVDDADMRSASSCEESLKGSPTRSHRQTHEEEMTIPLKSTRRGENHYPSERKNNLRNCNASEEMPMSFFPGMFTPHGEDYPHEVCVQLGERTDSNITDYPILSHSLHKSLNKYNPSTGGDRFDDRCDGELIPGDTRRGDTYAGAHLHYVCNSFGDPKGEGILTEADPCSSYRSANVRGSNGVMGTESSEEVPQNMADERPGGDRFAVELLYSSSTFRSNTTEGSNDAAGVVVAQVDGEQVDGEQADSAGVVALIHGRRSDPLGKNGPIAKTEAANHYSPEHVQAEKTKKSSSFVLEHDTRSKPGGMFSIFRSRSAHMVKEPKRDCPIKLNETTPICNNEMSRKKNRSNGLAKMKGINLSEQIALEGEQHEGGSNRLGERTTTLGKLPKGCALAGATLPNENGGKKKKKIFKSKLLEGLKRLMRKNDTSHYGEPYPVGQNVKARRRRINSYHEEAIASEENIYRNRRSASVTGTSTWKEKIRRTLISDRNGEDPITHDEYLLSVEGSHQMRSESVGEAHLGGSMGNVCEKEEANRNHECIEGGLPFSQDRSEHKRKEGLICHANNLVDRFEFPMELEGAISSTSSWNDNSSSRGAFDYNKIGSSERREKGDASTFEGMSRVGKCGEENPHVCNGDEKVDPHYREEEVTVVGDNVDRENCAWSNDSAQTKQDLQSKQSEEVTVLTPETTRGKSTYAEMWNEDCARFKPHHVGEHTSGNETLNQENAKLTGLNETLSVENAKLTGLNETLSEENGKLIGLNETLSEENAKLVGSNETLCQENAKLSSEMEELKREEEKHRRENEQLQEELSKLRTDMEEAKEKYLTELSQLRTDVEKAREARDVELNLKLNLQTEQEELLKKCERLENDKEALTTEKMNNVLKMNNLKEELNRQNKCMNELRKELREKEEEIVVCRGKLTTMEKTLNETNATVEELNSQIEVHVENEKSNKRRVDMLEEEVQKYRKLTEQLQCARESHQASGEESKGDNPPDEEATQREPPTDEVPQGKNLLAIYPLKENLDEKLQQSNTFIELLKGRKGSFIQSGDDNEAEKKLPLQEHQLLCDEIDALGVDELKGRCKSLAWQCTQLILQLDICTNGSVEVPPDLGSQAKSVEQEGGIINKQGDSPRRDGKDAIAMAGCTYKASPKIVAKHLMAHSNDWCNSSFKEILRRTSEIAKHVDAVNTKLCRLEGKNSNCLEDGADHSECLVLLNSISTDILLISKNVSLLEEVARVDPQEGVQPDWQSDDQPDGQPDLHVEDRPSDLLNSRPDDEQITASPEEPSLPTQLPNEELQKGRNHSEGIEFKLEEGRPPPERYTFGDEKSEDANHLTCSENFVTFFEICFSSDLFLILCHVCKGVLEMSTWARKGEEENCLRGVHNLVNCVAEMETLCRDGDDQRGELHEPSNELIHLLRRHLQRLVQLTKKDNWRKRTHEVMHALCDLRKVVRIVLYSFLSFHGVHSKFFVVDGPNGDLLHPDDAPPKQFSKTPMEGECHSKDTPHRLVSSLLGMEPCGSRNVKVGSKFGKTHPNGEVLRSDTDVEEDLAEVNLDHLAKRVIQHNYNAHVVPCLIAYYADEVILERCLTGDGIDSAVQRKDDFATQMSNYATDIFRRISERMKWNELIISADSFATYFDEGALKSKLTDNLVMHKNKKINIDTVYEHLGVLFRRNGPTRGCDGLFGEYFRIASSSVLWQSLSYRASSGGTPHLSSALESACLSSSVPPRNLLNRNRLVQIKSASFTGKGEIRIHRKSPYFDDVAPPLMESPSRQVNHCNDEASWEYPLIRLDNECVSALFHMWHAMEKKFFFKISKKGEGTAEGNPPPCIQGEEPKHGDTSKVKPYKGDHTSTMDTYLRSMVYDTFQCSDGNKQIGVNNFIFLLKQLGIQVRDSELHSLWCILTGKKDVNKAMKETIPVSTFVKKAYSTNPSLVFYEHCKAKVKLREAEQNLRHLRRYNKKLLLLVNNAQQVKQLPSEGCRVTYAV
ncbi:Uncharacterized protein PCOAH_00043320 [Plasmodium coatneyi]|uniref:Uncharacterized protein n=1 Tax=Plasmodium coatneyi TaxID=208452 RepID=A0A1B1E3L9_9APIC|nr:Uncharacterized protein PCOAH_00043320 [Plasmodium coatneyi]ANQ09605.1 Uncharacterized protein PCOAH_00043320 [Plasmodium coatneyi]